MSRAYLSWQQVNSVTRLSCAGRLECQCGSRWVGQLMLAGSVGRLSRSKQLLGGRFVSCRLTFLTVYLAVRIYA